jgi:hypothetical protein
MPVSKPFFFETLAAERPSDEGVSGLSSRGWFAWCALTLLFFALLNFAMLQYLHKYTPNFGYWLIDQKWNLLLDLEQPQDVLVMGDSAANQAVIPELITAETGLRTVNLATVANLTFLNDVWMLRQYLHTYAPPKAVVIVHTYQMWHRPLNTQAYLRIPFGPVDEAVAIQPAPSVDAVEYLSDRALYYLPVYSQAQSLRSLVRTVVQIPPDFSQLQQSLYSISKLGYFSVVEANASALEDDIAEHLVFLEQRAPFVADESVRGVLAMRALAEQYGFEVYLVNAPIVADVASTLLFDRYFQQLDSDLRGLVGDSEHMHYIDGQMQLPQEMMESVDHVLESGAHEFTLDMIIPLLNSMMH